MLMQHPTLCTTPLKTFSSFPSPQCDDCVGPMYSTSMELTSECTDQCVVVACSGAEGLETHCQGENHCDFVCDGVRNCTDCRGLDDLFQCCVDYHATLSEPQNEGGLPRVSIPWDPSLDELLCACGVTLPPSTHSSSVYSPAPALGPNGHIPKSALPGNLPISHMPLMHHSPLPQQPLPPPAAAITSPVDTPLDTPRHLSPASAQHSCMWADCHSSFQSLSELVGHVNHEHLRLPVEISSSVPPPNMFPSVNLSCQWGNCDLYPSIESIPSTSSGDSVDLMLNTLAHHLLYDHLGTDSLPQSIGPPQKNQAQSGLIQPMTPQTNLCPLQLPQTPSPTISEGNHCCRWESCGAVFNTLDNLTTHITNVHIGGGKAQYECFWGNCNRHGANGFSSKQKICRHIQSHTGHRPHKCHICNQYFSEVATLQQHMRRHTHEKPYVCDYPECGKSFAITGALTIHKRIHNGLKPFKCKYCDRAFAESSNLSKHLRTHTGVRPYSCAEPGCNKSFARPDQLTRHLAVHRKKKSCVQEATMVVVTS